MIQQITKLRKVRFYQTMCSCHCWYIQARKSCLNISKPVGIMVGNAFCWEQLVMCPLNVYSWFIFVILHHIEYFSLHMSNLLIYNIRFIELISFAKRYVKCVFPEIILLICVLYATFLVYGVFRNYFLLSFIFLLLVIVTI